MFVACSTWPTGWRSCVLEGAQLDPPAWCRTDWLPLDGSSKLSPVTSGWLSIQDLSSPTRALSHPPSSGSMEF